MQSRPVTRKEAMIRLKPNEYPRFTDDMSLTSARKAAQESLKYLTSLPASALFQFGHDTFSATHMARSIETFIKIIDANPTPEEINAQIKKKFSIYQTKGGRHGQKSKALFTGYYEPVLSGSLSRTPKYQYPIYRQPDNLAQIDMGLFDSRLQGRNFTGRCSGRAFVPYYDRKEIDSDGALHGNGYELLWVRDPVTLFFLHIQGSGKVVLENGKTLNVGYACANGRPYKSIGKLLIDEGKITLEDMSMQRIRAYLEKHPEDMERIFNYNQSYVFFRFVDQGPIGSISVPLTPGRSIATDKSLFPKGALAFITSEKPVIAKNRSIQGWQKFSRFAFNQDTGGAIKGEARVDLFFGKGLYASLAAGSMKQRGKVYFLVLKN
ncbi:MAG: MltA domain-containing protein [Pseudomonadota bacterium]